MRLKLTVLLPVLLISALANAQFKKGTRMVGATVGSIFFNSGSSDVSFPSPTTGYTSKTNSFGASIAPSLGWFVSDRIAAGFTLNINPSKTKTTYENNGNTFQKDEASTFTFGPGGFCRVYFPVTGSLKPFTQVSFNISIANKRNTEGFAIAPLNAYKITYEGKSSEGFFTNSTLAIGITKMINPNVGLDIFTGYTYSTARSVFKTTTFRDDGNNGSVDLTSIDDRTTESTGHGFVVGVGLQIFLQK
jgi:hypothetical protein